jgi:primosomal protein N' (replication factor Y)
VVLADVTLHLTDFRSAERTFSLLTQVAGRSGRGEKAGKVIIQTFSPDHYAIKRAQSQDYEGFYAEEFRHRQETRFPPVVQLVEVLFKGKNETRVVETAKEMMVLLKENSQGKFDLLGLSPCPVSRMSNQYYWHLLLRGESIAQISEGVQKVLREYKQRRGVTIKIDVDPY